MQQPATRYMIALAVLIGLFVLAGLGFVYSGAYDIGADNHHSRPVYWAMQTLRDRSIEVRADELVVPDLTDPQRILVGAAHYDEMCTGCHLKPGMDQSELRQGLYPLPPPLARHKVAPKEAFWVIKHGIKMSAMPAWGLTHNDDKIWSMVAFLQKLPGLSPAQYQSMVERAPADEDDEQGGHEHPAGHEMAGGHDHEHHGGMAESSSSHR